jgi:hypothetical protein
VAIVVVGTASGIAAVDDGAAEQLSGQPCTALAVEGLHLWAVVDDATVMGGPTNRHLAPVATIEGRRARCLLPHGGGLLVGTDEAHLLRIGDGSVEHVSSFDDVEGREKWYTPWGGPPDTRSLSASHGTIYANVHVGGIVRSTDGGGSWEPTIDIDADVHQVLAHPDNAGLLLASTAWGLARSNNGGGDWSFHDEGLHASYSRAVAVAGDTLLVSASTGPRGGRAALYRRPLAKDGPFERCTGGLPEWFPGNIDTHCLAAFGGTLAFGTEKGDVFRSGDEGRTWEKVASGLPAIRAIVLR